MGAETAGCPPAQAFTDGVRNTTMVAPIEARDGQCFFHADKFIDSPLLNPIPRLHLECESFGPLSHLSRPQ